MDLKSKSLNLGVSMRNYLVDDWQLSSLRYILTKSNSPPDKAGPILWIMRPWLLLINLATWCWWYVLIEVEGIELIFTNPMAMGSSFSSSPCFRSQWTQDKIWLHTWKKLSRSCNSGNFRQLWLVGLVYDKD